MSIINLHFQSCFFHLIDSDFDCSTCEGLLGSVLALPAPVARQSRYASLTGNVLFEILLQLDIKDIAASLCVWYVASFAPCELH